MTTGEEANVKCPRDCNGHLENRGGDWSECDQCGNEVHQLAVDHRDGLRSLADSDTEVLSEMAEILLETGGEDGAEKA